MEGLIAMPAVSFAGMQEYLEDGYRPDVEYLDAFLKPKTQSGFRHGETLGALAVWFEQHRREWNIRCALNVRVQVTSSRTRLVDFVVAGADTRNPMELTSPPVVAIEVLDDADTYVDLKARASELAAMGTTNIWLIDPESKSGSAWRNRTWYPERSGRLQAAESAIFLDLDLVWQRLDEIY